MTGPASDSLGKHASRPSARLKHALEHAVRSLDVGQARVNERGTGSPQYPPTLMLGLLIDSYATGTFSSRQIQRATYENVAVRLLCADGIPITTASAPSAGPTARCCKAALSRCLLWPRRCGC